MASQPPTQSAPPTPSQLQSAFDASIWYALSLWPALHVAVQNHWGGPSSADKRDWFAGAISDLFVQNPATDFEDVVVVLLQVMQDEFEVNVEDDSEEVVAREILILRKRILEDQDLSAAHEIEQRWKSRARMKTDVKVVDEGDQEVDDDDEEDGEGLEDEDEDVEMEDAGEAARNLLPALEHSERSRQ